MATKLVTLKDSKGDRLQPALPVGSIIYWPGKMSTFPTNCMLCDGRELDVFEYAELFSIIGHIYSYNGATPGYFHIPNLLDTEEGPGALQPDGSTGYVKGEEPGVFIRASRDDHTIGLREPDEIRNIKGSNSLGWWGEYEGIVSNDFRHEIGAFCGEHIYYTIPNDTGGFTPSIAEVALLNKNKGRWLAEAKAELGIHFDADKQATSFEALADGHGNFNPMAGHAHGGDIHPVNVRLFPIIAVK